MRQNCSGRDRFWIERKLTTIEPETSFPTKGNEMKLHFGKIVLLQTYRTVLGTTGEIKVH